MEVINSVKDKIPNVSKRLEKIFEWLQERNIKLDTLKILEFIVNKKGSTRSSTNHYQDNKSSTFLSSDKFILEEMYKK